MRTLERAFKQYMPEPVVAAAQAGRRVALHSLFWAMDAGEALLGRREPLSPPRRLRTGGTNKFTRSDFHQIGGHHARCLVEVGGLKPDDRVLDVGCGVGRMAIQLTKHLSPAGSYDGFDVLPHEIEWCQRNITPKFPRFRFHFAQVFNSLYSDRASTRASEFRFPFPDGSLSFVFLISVFTHMTIDGVEGYLREIRRVLTPGGRCYATHFLLNEAAEELIAAGKSRLTFRFPLEHGRTDLEDAPEAAVAQDEKYVLELYERAGLTRACPVRRGSWAGRTSDVGYQDVIVTTAR